MTKAATFQLEMTRFIRAPRERVFDAFTDQAALAVWHCPRGMSVLEASADPRVGGRYRVVMGGRDGSRHIAVGEYQQLDRADFLAYTWAWESGSMPPDLKTLIEVTLTDQDGGTHLHMRHSGFPDMQTRNGHLAGWQSVFNRLSDYLDPEGSAGTVTVYGDRAAATAVPCAWRWKRKACATRCSRCRRIRRNCWRTTRSAVCRRSATVPSSSTKRAPS